jgi:hypothetical protein
VQLKYKEKTEGFGFGDVVMAGILGTVFPVFISVGVLEWVYLLSTYLIVSCILGIIVYGILYWTSPKRITPHTAPTIPFLPSMIIAFIFFVVEGNTLISFLVHM